MVGERKAECREKDPYGVILGVTTPSFPPSLMTPFPPTPVFPSRPRRRRWVPAMHVCEDHLGSPSQAHRQLGGDPGWTPLPHLPNDVSPLTCSCPPSASSTFADGPPPSTRPPPPQHTHPIHLCSNSETKGLTSSLFPGRATLKNGQKICLDPQAPLYKKIMKKLMKSKPPTD